ncbi:co-chaperone DjlA [Candidatus Tachikawaea gelatinosa]|uniref:DnaJ-like protein DjlA n=1 Tax=Candidatus Tachikawaea gelatinosa TaxID=1410383 RepID=A0A090AM96_9ENTR|nr:co-chaperone DjlA [Candidatus Tachikawaea gelatinosa]BAP58784.1 DnaJ-like protein DjlA [Candidatus Tachikawaea gelatinosa]
MHPFGKIFGILIGSILGTGFWNIIIGFFIGYIIDKIFDHKKKKLYIDDNRYQKIFICTTFQVMGNIAKSKGYVSAKDIRIVSTCMNDMQLNKDLCIQAQQAFRYGKQNNYPLRYKLKELRQIFYKNFDIIKFFFEIQIKLAFSDEVLHPNERNILYVIAQELSTSKFQLDYLLNMIEEKNFFFYHKYHRSFQTKKNNSQSTIENAYNTLKVKKTDDNITIKRAYRKFMNKYHPDKLSSIKTSSEMLNTAKQKMQIIQKAYNIICKERNLK